MTESTETGNATARPGPRQTGSIRHRLLAAFLGLISICTGAMTFVAYVLSRDALQREIDHNLQTQAVTLARHLDRLLYERLQNLATWRRLEIMQELRIDDVDKRLARFLSDLKHSHGHIYRSLFCIRRGRILAASNARRIGHRASPPHPWVRLELDGTRFLLAHPRLAPQPSLEIWTGLTDAYTGKPLGTLHARLDWGRVQQLFDTRGSGAERPVLLLDATGLVIGASRTLRKAGWPGTRLPLLLPEPRASGIRTLDLAARGLGRVLAGFASLPDDHGLGRLRWKLLVLTPMEQAFAPVRRLLWSLLVLMLLTMGGAGLLALRLSKRIALPLQWLTHYVRNYPRKRGQPPAIESRDEVGELAHAFQSMVTALERYEAELLHIGKLAAAGEMAANLAHEIRTPLGILRSSAQLLGRRPGLDERGREMVHYILEEADRINRLLTQLLDSARPKPPKFEPVDPCDLLAHVAGMVSGEVGTRSLTLETDCDRAPPALYCDREQMIQILLNLVMNAIQILPQGGRIEVHVEQLTDETRIRVEDDGPGIPENERDRILEPFVSRREGGTGLGLTVVQQLVRLHGGRLAVRESRLGGAAFVIHLPDRPSQEET